MAPLRIRWDERETAIMMDYFIQYKTGKITQADAISKTSKELRERAKKNRLKIDDTFRNENGIRMQMSIIEDLYTGRKVSLNNGKASPVFKNVLNKYLNDRATFDKILNEAREISDNNSSVKEQFFKWLSNRVLPVQISELCFIYSEIEALLFPNVRKPEDIRTKDFQKYCLRPATKMRGIIKIQLGILDKEFKGKSVPSFSVRAINEKY